MSEDRMQISVTSKNYRWDQSGHVSVDVNVRYSPRDWEELAVDAARLGYDRKDLLKERFKRAARPDANISRVEDASARRKLYEGHSDYWLPFVKYLIWGHLTVLAGGYAVEFLLNTGDEYLLHYWAYLASLVMAIIAWLGFKLTGIAQGVDGNAAMMRTELWVASASVNFMWASLATFSLSLLLRIAFGLRDAGLLTLIQNIAPGT